MRRRRVPGRKISPRREPIPAPAVYDPDGECPKPPQPPLSPLEAPLPQWRGFSVQERPLSGHQPQGQVHMPTWREDALRGATLGLLLSLGVVLLFGGVVYWL